MPNVAEASAVEQDISSPHFSVVTNSDAFMQDTDRHSHPQTGMVKKSSFLFGANAELVACFLQNMLVPCLCCMQEENCQQG